MEGCAPVQDPPSQQPQGIQGWGAERGAQGDGPTRLVRGGLRCRLGPVSRLDRSVPSALLPPERKERQREWALSHQRGRTSARRWRDQAARGSGGGAELPVARAQQIGELADRRRARGG